MAPRVLVLIKGLGIGGAERLIAESAPVWLNGGFEYHVAHVLPWKDQLVPTIREAGIDVTCLGGAKGTDLLTPMRLRRLVRSWRPDIVHSHSPSVAVMARTTLRGVHVYTEHNIVDSYRQPTRTLNRATYHRNRAVSAVSQAVADSLAGYPGPTPVVVPNGVSPNVTADERAAVRAELAHDGPLVVHVGNIRPMKGHRNLTEATVALREMVPDVLVVSIGGEKYPGDLERVRAEAAELGVADSIRFLGRREDARAFLAAADVVANPSDVEGLPLNVLEALALARPVVATAVGGVPSVVIPGETGVLVEPSDPQGLAAAIAATLANPAAAGWGRSGATLVAERHGVEPMVRALEELYRSVLA